MDILFFDGASRYSSKWKSASTQCSHPDGRVGLCKNHQSLALISLSYGALVLNDFFLKAMKEVVTSSTGAGAIVRNLKGFALYSDKDKSYEIEIFFRGRPLRDIVLFFMVWMLRDIEKFFWGTTLRDIKSDNLILNPSSSGLTH
ncbi:unnamed protein product [Sphagnum jensenii]|uniref:Uncharacterized protein n=1 Tax=Sphagnum jensenii TaxID=128206 RepID=A0ABP1AZJ1_9BRYO